MGKYEKLLSKILQRQSDKNIAFVDLRHLMVHLGFEERIRGSHHIFRKAGIEEKVNLQRDGIKAKPYQVKQIRSLVLKYKLGEQNK